MILGAETAMNTLWLHPIGQLRAEVLNTLLYSRPESDGIFVRGQIETFVGGINQSLGIGTEPVLDGIGLAAL